MLQFSPSTMNWMHLWPRQMSCLESSALSFRRRLLPCKPLLDRYCVFLCHAIQKSLEPALFSEEFYFLLLFFGRLQISISKPQNNNNGSSSFYSANRNGNESIMSFPQSSTSSITTESIQRSLDSTLSRKESNLDKPTGMILKTASPSPLTQQSSPFMPRKDLSDNLFTYDQMTPPNMSPKTIRSLGMASLSYREPTVLSSPTYDNKTARSMMQPLASPLASSARPTQPYSQQVVSTLPRNFQPFRTLGNCSWIVLFVLILYV